MALYFHCGTGHACDVFWYVGQVVSHIHLHNLEEITADGHELEHFRQRPMNLALWKDQAFLIRALRALLVVTQPWCYTVCS